MHLKGYTHYSCFHCKKGNTRWQFELYLTVLQDVSAHLATRAHMVVLSRPSVALALFSLHLGSQLVSPAQQVIKKPPVNSHVSCKVYTNKAIWRLSQNETHHCAQVSTVQRVHLYLPRVQWAVSVHQPAGHPLLTAPLAPLAPSVTAALWQSRLDPAAQVWQSRIIMGNDVRKLRYESVSFSSNVLFLLCINRLNNMYHLSFIVIVAVFSVGCLTVLSTTGHFCSPGSTEPSPVSRTYGDVCPMGHFCPLGSGSPKRCPVGSFLPEPGASSPSHCHPCPPGKYCNSPGSSQPTGGEFHQVVSH